MRNKRGQEPGFEDHDYGHGRSDHPWQHSQESSEHLYPED